MHVKRRTGKICRAKIDVLQLCQATIYRSFRRRVSSWTLYRRLRRVWRI